MSVELGIFLALVGFKAACKFRDWLDRPCVPPRRKKKTGGIGGQFNTLLRPGLREDFWENPNKVIQDTIIAAERRTGASTIWDGVLTGQTHNKARFVGDVFYPGKVIFVDTPGDIQKIRWPKRETYDEAYWRAWRRKHKHEDDPG